MSFQIPTTTTAASTGFSFGLVKPTTASGSSSFGGTGGGDAGTTQPLKFGTQPTAATTTTAATGFGSGFSSAATTEAKRGATTMPSATTAGGLNFAAPAAMSATSAPVTNFDYGTKPAAGLAPLPAAGGFASLTTATKTTDSSAAASTQMSYNQIEENVNKWIRELEEQEKVFIDQATQINAYDNIVIANYNKISELNDAVQKVKSDQQTLEQELEFIATQHKELQEIIDPLQTELPQVDVERSQTFSLVENLDSQLKQMSEDLTSMIDNLNEANKGKDNTDPIIQIGDIMNAHINSLKWIETSASNISNKLDDIGKMHESFKRESERTFRSDYFN